MVPLVFALALCLPAAPATAQDRSETTHDKTATIDFLDVGQGDAILIRSPEGKTALIDAGPSKEIVRLIRERGVKSIDLVVVSHHHADHYGGMDAVIKTFRPRFFLENLKRWLPRGVLVRITPIQTQTPPKAAEKGIALTELLGRVKGVIDEGFPKAEWVRAEISELRGKNGHLYLTLTERNEQGDILAQVKGIIWRNRAETITAKFEEATGEGLKTDIKILCLAKVRFDPLYGLDLIIEDVDPSYTLGDLAAKLARIREKLQQTGLYDRNKQLPAPVEFVRVAVISPETSAGLGDFRREADRLQTAILCEFHLFPATFQGVETSSSIQTAVLQALTAHKQKPTTPWSLSEAVAL